MKVELLIPLLIHYLVMLERRSTSRENRVAQHLVLEFQLSSHQPLQTPKHPYRINKPNLYSLMMNLS